MPLMKRQPMLSTMAATMSDMDIRAAREAGRDEGRDEATDTIVRWLRDEAEKNCWLSLAAATAFIMAARKIESGEHLKPADEGQGA
jgi:hypothetical protein